MNSYAIIMFHNGPFGGATKRYANLYNYLLTIKGINIYFLINNSFLKQLELCMPYINFKNVIVVPSFKEHKINKLQNALGQDESVSKSNNKIYHRWLIWRLYFYIKTYRRSFKIYNSLSKIFKELNIKVVLAIYNGIFPLYFIKNKKHNPAVIFSNMDSWFSKITENSHKDWYRKYVSFNYAHENSDLVDFLSPFIYIGVQKLGVNVSNEKVNITPNSFIDYSKCHIGDKRKFRIAFSGRLEKDKNPVMFMNAALQLAEEYSEVEFHIMGEGRLSNTIKDITSKCGLANILFHGFHPNPPEILSETSVFVSIQTTNNYPSQSVLEAMACGNAIIASDVGDTRMFVSEETGSLIELSLDRLIDCLRKYIAQPQIALEKGIKASKYVRENHTIEKSADYYMELFRKAHKMVT